MIRRLYIKNVALIDEAEAEFEDGVNVLSGETGSGKSVILDSLNFVLGSKADKSMIRFGESEAQVRAEFELAGDDPAIEILREMDIDSDGEIIISRRFDFSGKSKISVNGAAVSASMLKALSQRLVDVHGQSEHFFLLDEGNQLKTLDSLLDEEGAKIKAELAAAVTKKRGINDEIKSLGGDEGERARRADMLKFAIDEIERAGVEIGETDRLKERQRILQNSQRIFEALNEAQGSLSADEGALDKVRHARSEMESLSDMGEDFKNLYERLENTLAELEDIEGAVEGLFEDTSYSETEADQISERLYLLSSLKRKYGGDEESILGYLEKSKKDYDDLQNAEEKIGKLEQELKETNDEIYALCVKLTEKRKAAAKDFCKNVTRELTTLNIPHADFDVRFTDYDRSTANLNSASGTDAVSFMFSANKGEEKKPLSKIISGGEMSRFMLAVKTVLRDINGISTFVFDEIDSGISGHTANVVAEKFISLGRSAQVLAVSHLPQVCASAATQFRIYKVEEGEKTFTRIERLSEMERVDEIVRLLGGEPSDAAREHAKELLNLYSEKRS